MSHVVVLNVKGTILFRHHIMCKTGITCAMGCETSDTLTMRTVQRSLNNR